MIGERRFGRGSRGRSPSPPPPRRRRSPPRSRDVNPPRNSKCSPYRRREREEYSGQAKASWRDEKRGHFDDRAPRFSASDDRDRDRDGDRFGGRRFRSPQRIEERDGFDRPVSLSNYGDGAKGKYDNELGVGDGGSRRTCDEDSYRGDLSSMKLKWDNPLDGFQKSDHLSMKKYSPTRGSGGAGDINVSSSSDRDYYLQNRYMDSSQAGLPVSRYLDSTLPVSLKYETGGKMQSHSYSLSRGRVDDIPARNSSGGGGVGSSSYMSHAASQYLNSDADKDRNLPFRDELYLEKKGGFHDREDNYFEKKSDGFQFQDKYLGVGKSVESELYKFKKEDDLISSQSYLKGGSDYMVSSSQRNDYNPVPSGILRDGLSKYSPSRELHMPSSDHTDVVQGRGRLASQQVSYDRYSERKQNMLPTEPGGQYDDTRNKAHLYVGLPEERRGDWSYTEHGRSKIDTISKRLNNVEEDYRDQHTYRSDVLKHTIDTRSHKEHMEDDGLREQYPFQVQSTPDKFDLRGSLHVRMDDADMLGTGSTHLNYGSEGYYRYGGVKTDKHHAEIDSGRWSNIENSDTLQSKGYDPTFGRLYTSPRKRLPMEDLSLVEPCERRLGGEHVREDIYDYDVGIRISADGNGARRIYNQVDMNDEFDLSHFSKKPRSGRPDYEKTLRVSSELGCDGPSSSEFYPDHKPHKYVSRDIKNRLGPIQKLHVSQRLMKKYKPSIKKRLAPAPPKRHATYPWIKNMSSSKMTRDQNDSDRAVHNHDGDHSGDHLPVAKREPPEKSEEFKQLVQSAFFKYLKQINETPVKRKNFTEQGKAGILKCFVCGSNSKEFAGTKSLAMHTFTCQTLGLRSQHLGLHEALCALMGWKITKHPSSNWHCEVMTDSETQVLKEDLIIWPPVVVVHNSTIDSTSPGDRVIISAEKLDTKLRDLGFGSILKVCNGKPANQSVLLVKFNGTLSGLQEAERLYQSYVESKHGRTEFTQLKSESGSSRGGAKVKSSGAEDHFLYGYLGIAEDLEKLDFDTKKRCVLRSKTKILRIVDEPIDTEGQTDR